jgi:hypothetical protein
MADLLEQVLMSVCHSLGSVGSVVILVVLNAVQHNPTIGVLRHIRERGPKVLTLV